jgi:sigma-B regulation protein RsbU (phosphoserine phosphatase)
VVAAGHPPPVVLDDDGAREVRMAAGPPLGVREPGAWSPVSVELPAGAGLLLYTDGLTEACSPGQERAGVERVLYEADRLRRAGCDGDELLDGLVALAAGAHAPDDIALLLVDL